MPDPDKVTMSKTAVFNGDSDGFYDPNFTMDINRRMRVPKSIRVSGDYSDDDASTNGSGTWNPPMQNDKFDMRVPDRILVTGQDQHVGMKAPPIEMALEKSVTQPITHGMTPPRVLTLGDHFFPTVDDGDMENFENASELNTTFSKPPPYESETQIARRAAREQTPIYSSLDVSLPPSEEIQHLRRQVGKLNRRVMAVELEIVHRQQRDKILYAITIAYFFLKAFNWISRN
ncbi:transport and Golgi organization protein 11 isoform X2 [Fopius arisanus]|uniref:Transport and Golgi organization protein 11 isoform X2 n=1 Tax=Fopius arisanus TaxID=64838 RepID=A0A9R1U8M3_9HYME|nr:PREDICTED: transport and Golgi organization protein 11 isoform X2 [Fopius arisanus]